MNTIEKATHLIFVLAILFNQAATCVIHRHRRLNDRPTADRGATVIKQKDRM